MVNTDTQRIITGEMGAVISIVSGRAYTVSVMAVGDDSQRSEPDRESVTAGGYRKDLEYTALQCYLKQFVKCEFQCPLYATHVESHYYNNTKLNVTTLCTSHNICIYECIHCNLHFLQC